MVLLRNTTVVGYLYDAIIRIIIRLLWAIYKTALRNTSARNYWVAGPLGGCLVVAEAVPPADCRGLSVLWSLLKCDADAPADALVLRV